MNEPMKTATEERAATGESLPDALLLIVTLDAARSVAREILEGVRRLAPDAEILEPGDAAAVGGAR